jgi:DNA-binding CsgD family transcriptional regulator
MVGDFAPVLKLVDESGAHTLSAEERLWVDWARSEQAVDLRQQLHSIQATAAHAREAGSPMLSWILLSAITSAWCLGDAGTATASAAALRELADPLRAAPDSPLPPWACRGVHAVNLFMTGEVASAHHEMQAVRAQSRAWRPRPDSPSMQMTAVTVVDDVMGQLDPWVDDRLAEVDRWFQRDPGQAVHFVRRVQAERARRRGELAVAEALVEEARRGLVRPSPLSRAWLAVTSMLVCAVTGDSAGVRSEAAQLRHDARLIGWVTIAPVADRAEGLLALGAGRLDDALLHLEPLTEGSLLGLGPWDAVPMGRADLVEALVRADEGARAAEVAHDLAEALGPSPDPIARGLVDRVRGIVDRGDEAGAALTRSAAAFREAGDPFEEARTRLLLGQLLRRERRIGPARRELRLAHATFERIGAAPWQADALAELRATRAAIPAPTRDPWADLTPQERRVAEAVAAGGTDRQVAAELFLSARTVGYHLTNVYRKLGVSNRTALAARLAERRPAAGQAGPG